MSESIELDWLARWNLYSPDSLALVDVHNDTSYSYGTFYKLSNALVPYLKDQGVEKGTRVAVLSQNKVETLFLFFALQRLGAILVPINFRFSSSEVSYVLKDSGAKVVFVEDCFAENVDSTLPALNVLSMKDLSEYAENHRNYQEEHDFVMESHDPCKILYTSGTTGFPKGVVITPSILFWNAITTAMSLNISQNDSTISFMPLFHTGGWNVLLTPFIHRGAKTLFLPGFDAEEILKLCEQEKTTLLFGVPTTLAMMSKHESFAKRDLSSIRYAVVGGEAMPLELIQTWHQKGVPVRQGFGMTEFGPNCFSLSENDAEEKLGSIGRPNFYVHTDIVDSEGRSVPVDETGELLLKGPMCMQGYWNNEEATKETIHNDWLRTGDLVTRDKDHYYYVVGRKKEMYISGGENVYPAEVERVLLEHPSIDEAAVIGISHDKWGEVGHAFIVCPQNNSLTSDDIADHCQQHLAKFKIPKKITFLPELPRGSTGKIQKTKLQDH